VTRAEGVLLAAVAAFAGFVGWQALSTRRSAPAPTIAAALPDESAAAPPQRVVGDMRFEAAYSALPAPRRDTAAVRRMLLAGGSGTWIDDMLRDGDSTLARWPERSASPITVWVQRAPGVAGWRESLAESARHAFGRWEMVGLPLRFVLVPDSSAAEVHVVWTDRLTVGTRIGSTRRVHDQHWWVVDADITIATHSVDGRPLDDLTVRTAALHEVGHLLGLGHTSDTTSIMAPRAYGTVDLSPKDLATVRLLYELPPGKVGRARELR
jgi:hypothetical protein